MPNDSGKGLSNLSASTDENSRSVHGANTALCRYMKHGSIASALKTNTDD